MLTADFSTISKIITDDISSWRGKVFLTFDFDWAPDEVLQEVIDTVEQADVAATWFVTHDTPVIQRLRENPSFELGIHPNFNSLLSGSGHEKNAAASEVISRLMDIVPEAKSVRSHSLTVSTRIMHEFARFGLTHDANMYIPHDSGVALRPWIDTSGLLKAPFFWEDDVQILNGTGLNIRAVLDGDSSGLRIFDFHPIHVFLNTHCLEKYASANSFIEDIEALTRHRSDGHGAARMLDELLSYGGRRRE